MRALRVLVLDETHIGKIGDIDERIGVIRALPFLDMTLSALKELANGMFPRKERKRRPSLFDWLGHAARGKNTRECSGGN